MHATRLASIAIACCLLASLSAGPTPGVRCDSVDVRDSVVAPVKIMNLQCAYLVNFDCSVVVLAFIIY